MFTNEMTDNFVGYMINQDQSLRYCLIQQLSNFAATYPAITELDIVNDFCIKLRTPNSLTVVIALSGGSVDTCLIGAVLDCSNKYVFTTTSTHSLDLCLRELNKFPELHGSLWHEEVHHQDASKEEVEQMLTSLVSLASPQIDRWDNKTDIDNGNVEHWSYSDTDAQHVRANAQRIFAPYGIPDWETIAAVNKAFCVKSDEVISQFIPRVPPIRVFATYVKGESVTLKIMTPKGVIVINQKIGV